MKFASLLAVALLALACAPDEYELSTACKTTADCRFGLVCGEGGTCEPEVTDAVVGRFSCTLYESEAAAPALDDTSFSDVITNLGDQRYTHLMVSCWGDDAYLQVALMDANQYGIVGLVIPGPFEAGQRIELAPAQGAGDEALARLIAVIGAEIDRPEQRVLGLSDGGFVTLRRAPALGEPLSGFIQLELAPTAGEGLLVGTPCPRGLADCGDWNPPDAYDLACVDLTDAGGGRVCTMPCATDADCLGAGVCAEICTQPCATDADCADSLHCLASGSRLGCF